MTDVDLRVVFLLPGEDKVDIANDLSRNGRVSGQFEKQTLSGRPRENAHALNWKDEKKRNPRQCELIGPLFLYV